MPAVIGFNKTTGLCGLAIESSDTALINARKNNRSDLFFVELPKMPENPHLYRYENGRAVKLDDYDDQKAALDIERAKPRYRVSVNATEYRGLLTIDERTLYDRMGVDIDGDLTFLNGQLDTQSPGKPAGITPRDQLRALLNDRSVFGSVDLAGADALEHQQLLRDVGIFASDERMNQVALGIII